MKNCFKKIRNVFISILLIFSLVSALEFFPLEERKVYTELIRLHILPNSSSEDDIALKLKVRDAILEESESIFAPCKTSEEAKKTMSFSGKKIEEIADRIISENGKTYKSKAVWGKETYPEREYDGLSLPAGEYYSLRILLGEGEGDNWWCVLFPPLCLGASKVEEGFNSVGISGDSVKTFTETKPKYRIKFKLLEWLFG
ncbi:MAG: stage II sporulation protein R [Clostridia bacterium]|nr:stage II sporulation protein R [Clostridia bacterium]